MCEPSPPPPPPPPPPPVADQPRQEAAAAGQPATEPHEDEAGQGQPATTAFKEPSRPRAASSSPDCRRGAVCYDSSSSSSPTSREYMDRLRGRAKELEGKEDPAASCSTHFQGGGRKMKKEAASSSSDTFEKEEEEEEEGSGVETMKDQSLAKEVIGCSIASTSASHLRQESAVRAGTSGIDSIPRTRSMEDVERLSYSPVSHQEMSLLLWASISSGNVSAASSAQSSNNDSANETTSNGHSKSVGDQEGDEDDMGGSTTKGDNEEEEEEGSRVETMKDQSLAKEVIGCSIASTSASHLRQESAVRAGTSGIDSIPRTRSMEDVERLSYSPDGSSGNVSAASSAQSCSNDPANATTSGGHAKSVADQEGDEDDMGGSTTKGDNEGDE